MTVYARPGTADAIMSFQSRYDNWIGNEWVAPVKGQLLREPDTGDRTEFSAMVARSTAEDIELALDAAHAAAPAWGKTSVAERAIILNKIADRMEENLESIALAESWDNGKPIRETLNADIPLAIDHFRYFAGAIRAQEGSLSGDQLRHRGVPLPRAARRSRPDHSVELPRSSWPCGSSLPPLLPAMPSCSRPAEQTPVSILHLIGIIGDLLPAGVLNIVNGFGVEAGKPLASQPAYQEDRVHR